MDFEKLKVIPVERIARTLGLKLRREPTSYRCACPLCRHRDQRAFAIALGGFWHCFRCDSTGDGLELVVRMKRLSHVKAAEWIVQTYGER